MGQEQLNGLALMYTHRHMELNLKDISLFATWHPRQMRMVTSCSDD